jgi:hypothetical protein
VRFHFSHALGHALIRASLARIREAWREYNVAAKLPHAILATILGSIAAGFLIGWHQIDPANVAWIRKDPAVYQAGWEFLRHEAWRFPPTWLDHLDFPFGISAAYLDVIPLVAVPLKLFSAWLPDRFQYLGLYALLCLVLQTYFALRLMARFTSDWALIVIGALFFLASPILLMRLYGHFSLCSQWLLLAALYCYFRPVGTPVTGYLLPFALLLATSAGITPYLSVMVFGVAIAALARAGLGAESHNSAPRLAHLLAATGIFLGCLLLSLVFFGFVTPGSMPTINAAGYGSFSMNLLAPLNPSGPSLLFRTFPVFPNQSYEGYNYLGAGIIALGVFCLARRPSLAARLWRPPLRPLVVLSLVFLVVAISAEVTFGQRVLVTIPLPDTASRLLAVFRSSGRFFWPVHELLTLGALVSTIIVLPSLLVSRTVLALALLVQLLDVLPIARSLALESSRTVSSPLLATDWQILAKSHRNLVVLPARQCDSVRTPGGDAAWPWFARLAATSGMTLNSVHAARSSAASEAYNCGTLPQKVGQGNLQRDTAYVLGNSLALLAVSRNGTHFCRRVDGFNLCTFAPENAYRSRALADILKAADRQAPP